jgi:glucose uptake protein GlcU
MEIIDYFTEIVVIVGGILFFIGKRKNNKLITGVGIGALIVFLVLGLPDFIEEFSEGYSDHKE